MTAPTTHPLAAAYLRDLELLLHGVDPGERAEVLAGVREHLEGTTGPNASDDDVRAALAELGPPQAIADEAYAGRSPQLAVVTTVVADRPRGTLSAVWVPIVVGGILGLGFLMVLVTGLGGVGYSEVETTSSTGETQTQLTSVNTWMVLFTLPMQFFVVVLPVAAFVLASSLWSRPERVRMILAVPIITIVLAVLPWLGYTITGTELGLNIGAWAALALIVLVATWIFGHDVRLGLRRAREVTAGST
jgi:hypothetical protein